MILSTHALTGAVIGKTFSSPWLVIFLSIIIHFSMDHLRHGEYLKIKKQKICFKNTFGKIALDIAIAAFIIWFFIRLNYPDLFSAKNVLLGTFFSILPDLFNFLYFKFPSSFFLKKIFLFHSWVHKYPLSAPERRWNLRNAANDILISLIAIILLFF